MGLIPLILVSAALLEFPAVDVTDLNGQKYSGLLQKLTPSELILTSAGKERKLSLSEVLGVRFSNKLPALTNEEQAIKVRLVDTSGIACSSLRTTDETTEVESMSFGKLNLSTKSVSHIRFSSADSKLDLLWKQLTERDIRQDLIVVQKGEVLDFLEGVVGGISESEIKFLLDGDEVPVPRNRVFGVIFFRQRPESSRKTICEIHGAGNDVLNVSQLTFDGQQVQAQLVSANQVTVPANRLSEIDFSLGKISYLSDMEPRDVKYTPFFDVVWEYRRDRNLDGDPLRIGKQTYSRGLCIHSRTLLKYRLGQEYRRFKAVMGIDRSVAPRGDVHVIIRGDGKVLFEADCKGDDEPRAIDLDVDQIRDLEIFVDFGKDLDISDHLDLADARVIK